MKLTFYNEIIQFDYELGVLIKASEDPMFTEYLKFVKGQLQSEPSSAEFLRNQVIDKYNLYSTKMNNLGCPVERFYFKAVYGDMEAPEIKNPIFSAKAPAPEPVVSKSQETVQESEVQLAQETVTVQSPAPEPVVQPARFDPYTGAPVSQTYAVPVSGRASSGEHKTEFAVGAVVMSVIGAIFLLTGLVYFSINFLDTFAQGMVMYLVCGLVIALSEFVIRRLVPKLSSVFTAIGISGVFLSTVVNYRSLENLNLPVTAIILAVCAGLVCFFGYVRKSRLYSLIGFLAAFISSIAIGGSMSPAEYIVITVGTLLISSLWLIFPVNEYSSVMMPVMLFAELTYLIAGVFFSIEDSSEFTYQLLKLIFLVCSMTVVNFIFYLGRKRSNPNHNGNDVAMVFSIIIYSVIVVFCTAFTLANIVTVDELSEAGEVVFGLIIYLIFVLLQLTFTIRLKLRNDRSYILLYVSFIYMGMLLLFGVHNTVIQSVLIVVHCLISRYLTLRGRSDFSLKIVDVILQCFIAFFAIAIAAETADMNTVFSFICRFILLAGLIAAMLITSGYASVVRILLTFSITIILGSYMLPEGLGEVVCLGVLLLFTYLFGNVRKLKCSGNAAFNWFSLIWSLILVLIAGNGAFSAEHTLVFIISVIFGLSIVILLMNRDYGMPFCGKYIMIPAYLTLVAFLFPLESGFVLSIILMAIAVVSVIIGFALKEKSIRIYGLILSILICGKIALIDFISIGDARAKTILYILVGALALAIGCIYMVLESRIGKAGRIAAGMQQTPVMQQPQPQYFQPQFTQPLNEEPQVNEPSDTQPVTNSINEGNLGNNDTL